MTDNTQKRRSFRFTILNENTLDTVFTTRLTKTNLWLFGIGLTLVLLLLFYVILFGTPLKTLLPGYLDPKFKQQMVADAFRLDTLSEQLDRQEAYMNVVRSLISGEYELDSTLNMDTLAAIQEALMETTAAEETFRAAYEESEKYNLAAVTHPITPEGVLFRVPVRGDIISDYDEHERHFGVDIKAAPKQTVVSVLDGQVLLSAYTHDYDYVLIIQHGNDFVSVYRQLSELLKKEGDTVKAGEALAFIGKNAPKEQTSHLHFELWYKGHPLNPEDYISF